ncbi:MAG TPA: SCO family protein [Verrucomicrobiae bacterium]|jgi:cytochrome oxidase Cu insertion factor (SCO1/SenC/PrrC family)
MADTPQPIPKTLWLGMSLVLGLLALAYLLSLVEMERHRHQHAALPILGKISDFALTNQAGQFTTLADLTNHVWVADIIFTRCAGPCPIMTGHMKSLQDALPAASKAKLVTLTTDPDFDSPSVLKRYGEHFGADDRRWTFLTGTKQEIANLGSGSLKLGSTPVKLEDRQSVADLFIHTTIFVLVDKHAQLRGVFQTGGDDVNWTNVQPHLVAAIAQLEHEP